MDAISLIEKHEGYRALPYKDSRGFLTVGYGHNLQAKTLDPQVLLLIQLAYHLQCTIDAQQVTSYLQKLDWFQKLDEVRQAVVVDMAYNLGIPKLLGFHQTLQAIQEGRYQDAAKLMLESEWAKQVGPRAIEDAALMRDGLVVPASHTSTSTGA